VTARRSFSVAPGTVRITGGHIKGRKLAVPEGAGVRPTTDRARETLFNVLTNRFRQPGGESFLVGARVLDGFAGTGAMGVEAWSRGATWVSFVENSPRHFTTMTDNLRTAKVPTLAWEAQRSRAGLSGPFDLIIADPPYEQGLALVQALIAETALWHAGTLLVWERSKTKGEEPTLAPWERVHQTPSGKTVFDFYRPAA
jgi:16S rRNA (guanine966-N2)-methyltransferase